MNIRSFAKLNICSVVLTVSWRCALGWRLALRLPIPANLAAVYDEARKVA